MLFRVTAVAAPAHGIDEKPEAFCSRTLRSSQLFDFLAQALSPFSLGARFPYGQPDRPIQPPVQTLQPS